MRFLGEEYLHLIYLRQRQMASIEQAHAREPRSHGRPRFPPSAELFRLRAANCISATKYPLALSNRHVDLEGQIFQCTADTRVRGEDQLRMWGKSRPASLRFENIDVNRTTPRSLAISSYTWGTAFVSHLLTLDAVVQPLVGS